MKIPKKLKVGARTFSVELVATKDQAKGRGYVGRTNFDLDKIHIERGMSPGATEETFLHELMHTATEAAGFGSDIECKEEELVNRLSKSLHAILKDNNMLK